MKLTPEQIAEIERFLASCESVSDARTAAAFGMTRGVVAHAKVLFRALNINVVSANPRGFQAKFDHDLALQMRSAGCTAKDVARHFRVGLDAIYKMEARTGKKPQRVTPADVLARLEKVS